MLPDLLPCPFCGGRATMTESHYGFSIEVQHEDADDMPCGLDTGDASCDPFIYHASAEGLAERWNRRVAAASQPEDSR